MIDYLALSPEIIIAATAVVVLLADLWLSRERKFWAAIIAVAGTTFAAVPLVVMALSPVGDRVLFDGSYVVDPFALVMKGLFLIAGYVVVLMSFSYVESDGYYEGEYYFLLLLSILGSLVLASGRDLISLFIGIELVATPMYVLSGFRKHDLKSNEAALKYYLLGVLASALLLYGSSFVYGLTGALTYDRIAAAAGGLVHEPAFIMAVLFILAGIGFKVSAVPFHFWAPDTYEGAPIPIAAYLSVSSKAAGFVALMAVVYRAFGPASAVWAPMIWVMAALSMTLANLSALKQNNIVRLLAYSSISHAGFMLVPFVVAPYVGPEGLGNAVAATVTYLVIYAFMNLGAFALVIAGSRKAGSGDVDGWAGMATYAPGLAFLGAVLFFGLAGIPPLAGWFAKFVMFRVALTAGSGWAVSLAVIAALNSVVAVYYYARVVKAMWMDPVPATVPEIEIRERPTPMALSLALGITAAVVLITGAVPGIVTFFSDATKVLVGGF
ncbi:MAG: NADH-quinone oxidoreductase subunit NuoN [Gammaproteobacteria bacterium]|nr:NADH-quinone oxidoreductase subunit NuoN [Gammaproteobacteria bacterium]